MKWWIFSTKKALKRKLFMSAIKTSEDVWHAGNVLSWGTAFLTILSTKLRRNLRKRTVLSYYASANATLVALLTRLFYSTPFDKTMKVGAAVVAARRGGLSATFDELNKFFTISGMPVASSQYWNSIHGLAPGEAKEDLEGLQTMRTLARNMTFLMKSIALGKEKFGLPETEQRIGMNFIR